MTHWQRWIKRLKTCFNRRFSVKFNGLSFVNWGLFAFRGLYFENLMSGYEIFLHIGSHCVAVLRPERSDFSWSLTYTNDWKEHGFAPSPTLPLEGNHSVEAVLAFIENLLLEGVALEHLSTMNYRARKYAVVHCKRKPTEKHPLKSSQWVIFNVKEN